MRYHEVEEAVKKRKKYLLITGLCCVFLTGSGVVFSHWFNRELATQAIPQFVPRVPKIPRTKQPEPATIPIAATLTGTAGTPQSTSPAQDSPALPAAGSVARLTSLRSELEEVKLKVAIEEQQGKLKKEPAPFIMPPMAPASADTNILNAPDLKLPARQSSLGRTVVLSIQGVGGKTTANLRTPEGFVIVSRGDRLENGSVVTSISRTGVQVQKQGQYSFLPFE